MNRRRFSTGSYMDSLHGYEDSFDVDDFLEDGHQLNMNIINLSTVSTRNTATQTDFPLCYPDVYAQALREVSLRHFLDLGSVRGSYINVKRARSISGVLEHEENLQNRTKNPGKFREIPQDFLDERVTQWIDHEDNEVVANRVSNSTVYEDIEDIVSFVEIGKDTNSPPPLPPRLKRSNSMSVGRRRPNKKNLYEHFGLDNLSLSTLDVISAQKIAFDNLRTMGDGALQSRKDLNKFLGICESPVKLRNEKRRSSRSRNSLGFIDNLISGRIFRGRRDSEVSRGCSEVDSPLKLTHDLSDTDSCDKHRTSSFSSTKSSASSSIFSSISSSSYDVTRSANTSATKEFLNPFRRGGSSRRTSSVMSDFSEYRKSYEFEEEDLVKLRLPLTPIGDEPDSDARVRSFDHVGQSLDAVIHFAQQELDRSRSKGEESIYMDMSVSNSSRSDVYMDMDAMKNLCPK